LLINNSELSHNQAEKGGGIYCDPLSNPLISSTILEYNQAVLGGGVYGDSSNFQLKDCFVRYNTANDKGGGIYCYGGSMPVFTNDTISSNQADEGGGLYALGSNLQVTDSYIAQNQATNGGGGIYLKDNSLQVFNNTHLSGNSAVNGGAVFADSCNIWLINSTLDYNTASQNGGAMYCLNSELELDTVNIDGNQANSFGAGVYCNNDCDLDFSITNFNNNISQWVGGGISIQNSQGTLSEVLLSQNEAIYGGGIYGDSSSIQIYIGNFYFNQATSEGGGIFTDNIILDLDETIFESNTASNTGGGIYAKYSELILFDVDFIGNATTNSAGGGIYSLDSDLDLDSVYFENNHAGYKGGGIHIQQESIMNISNSEFFQNTSGHDGGAISNYGIGTQCNLTNVSIKECISNIGGGGIAGFDANYELSNVNINDCQANHGGGVFLFGSSSMIADFSLITFNYSSTQGGGVDIWNNTEVELNNVTISKNDAGGDGKAIYTSSSNPLNLKNCIIHHHYSPEIAGSGSINATYSLICGYSGTGNICQYPYLTDPDNGDFTLIWDNFPYLSGIKSPCIDKGAPTSPKDADSTRADMGAIPYLQYYTALEGGDIYDTLFCTESPYFVFGDLTVPIGRELVIEPCVNVIFQGDYWLRVDGRLLAQGNDSTFIYFRSSDVDEGWQGIRFYDQNSNGQDSSRLEYCDIRYGNADGPGEDAKGGGLYFNNSSDVSVTSLYIYYCNATEKGGGIYCNSNSNLIINNFDSRYNTAYYGGGVFCDSSIFQIFKGFFYQNDANYGAGIYCTNATVELYDMNFIYNGGTENSKQGGGIYSWKSNLNINNALFEGNHTEWDGGAMLIYDNSICTISDALIRYCNTGNHGGGIYIGNNSEFEIIESEIRNNNSNNDGGGIYNSNSELTVNNCEIMSNIANDNGGGIYGYSNAEIAINNSKITNNKAFYNGGGVFLNHNSNLNMEYTLVANNIAQDYYGGGIAIWNLSTIDLMNVTLSKNSDNGLGSAIYKENGNLSIKNSIIWDNSEEEIYYGYGGNAYSYSNFPLGYGGTTIINTDPLFRDPDNGDFNLLWANFPINDSTKSPCINTGDPNSPLDPDSTRVDMGALYFDHYQYSPVITAIVDVPNDQGKHLVISWDKSPLDHFDTAKITHYKIWRQQNWAKTPWEYIGETPAHFFDEYSYIAPTISDSTAAEVPLYHQKPYPHHW